MLVLYTTYFYTQLSRELSLLGMGGVWLLLVLSSQIEPSSSKKVSLHIIYLSAFLHDSSVYLVEQGTVIKSTTRFCKPLQHRCRYLTQTHLLFLQVYEKKMLETGKWSQIHCCPEPPLIFCNPESGERGQYEKDLLERRNRQGQRVVLGRKLKLELVALM